MRLRKVTIIRDGNRAGVTLWHKRSVSLTPWSIICVAGPAAEAALGVPARTGQGYNYEDVRQVIALHDEEWRETMQAATWRAGLRYFQLRAEQLVRANWKAVAFIANELMREGTLKGREVERILRVLVPQVS